MRRSDSMKERKKGEIKKKKVEKKLTKSKNGSEGIIKVGENRLQIIFGDKAALIEKYYNKIKKDIEERLHHHSK